MAVGRGQWLESGFAPIVDTLASTKMVLQNHRRSIPWLSVVGAGLSLPLLLDMAIGLTTPIDALFSFIALGWWASLVIGIVAIVKSRRSGRPSGWVYLLAATPVVVFALGFLPIWPVVKN